MPKSTKGDSIAKPIDQVQRAAHWGRARHHWDIGLAALLAAVVPFGIWALASLQ